MKIRTHRPPGLVLTDHELDVPLDHSKPDGEKITLFAREVVTPANEEAELPWLLFLQGGPGFGSPRPTEKGGWLERALESYRVLLLDQRGTALSTPVLRQTLAGRPPADAAAYLANFRADAIVADAELFRRELTGDEPWTILGQSYGGFCATTYLSFAPDGLAGALFTGGIPPVGVAVDDVYRATYKRVRTRNQRYYERYPDDVARVQEIVSHIESNEVRLPEGDRLTTRRLQQIGAAFGAHDGFERVHYLIESALVVGASGPELGYPFLRELAGTMRFGTNPIYALLHESIYCEGSASDWSAERVRSEFGELEIVPDRPVYFTGEMVYPWFFTEYEELVPLREAAEILAAKADWGPLYDPAALARCAVPCAAAVYHEDMYVEREFSERTAEMIPTMKTWVTSEYHHDALRTSGKPVLDRLLGMLGGDL